MSNIHPLANRTHNNKMWTPTELLRHALESIEYGAIKPTSCLVLFQTDSGEGEIQESWRSNMTLHHEIVVLNWNLKDAIERLER